MRDTGGGVRGAAGTAAAAFLRCVISSSVEVHEGAPICLGDNVKLVVALGFNVVPVPGGRGEGGQGRKMRSCWRPGSREPSHDAPHARRIFRITSPHMYATRITCLLAVPSPHLLVPLEAERGRQHPQARLLGVTGAEQAPHGGCKRTGPAGTGRRGGGDGGGPIARRRLYCCSSRGYGERRGALPPSLVHVGAPAVKPGPAGRQRKVVPREQLSSPPGSASRG